MPELDILTTKFNDHCQADRIANAATAESLKALSLKISTIKENHLVHVQDDLNTIKYEIAIIKNNQKWMMGLGGLVGGGVSGVIMTAVQHFIT